MSERLCYIRRTDRGAALRGLRLLGGHTDDTWDSGSGADPTLVLETISESAEWIRHRLDASSSRELGALVLDPDGAVCTWVKPEDADPTMLDAAISEGPIEHDPDDLEPVVQSGISDRLPRLPRELDFQALSTEQTSTGARAAIFAIPDVAGLLLMDALDAMGIRPQRFTTIWHALSLAWDPGFAQGSSAQRIVSSDSPVAAVIAIDPIDARLIWTWSREGELICAGSMRLRRVQHDHEPRAVVRSGDIARLCADWLSWSSQLGLSPSRVVVLGDPAVGEISEDTPPHEQPLDPGQMGSALSQRWPDATIDLMGESDPIGATLRKIAQQERCGALGMLSGLESRPTRAHRSMFRWAGLALTGAALVVLLVGYQMMSRASAVRNETRAIQAQQGEALRSYDERLFMSMIPVLDLQAERNQIAGAQSPISVVQSKPILRALETVSFVIGAPGIEISKVTINNRTVTLTLEVDNITQAEQINSNLRSIDDRLLRWGSMTPQNRGNKIQVTYLAEWQDEEDAS